MRFVIRARQILKSETNKVGLIKKSYVEVVIKFFKYEYRGKEGLFFLNSDIPGLVVRLIMACLLVDGGGD